MNEDERQDVMVCAEVLRDMIVALQGLPLGNAELDVALELLRTARRALLYAAPVHSPKYQRDCARVKREREGGM